MASNGWFFLILRLLYAAAVLGIPAIGLTLWAWGQPLLSRSGDVLLWVNSVWSSENSQQVADWYTLSHVVQGMLVGGAGRLWGGRWGYVAALTVAVTVGVGWEIVEHTSWVLDRFRATTIYQGYLGDTVLNAVCDYLFMMGGFFAASVLRTGWSVLLMLALEGISAFVARDSLILTTLRVVHPVPAISAWQDALNPRSAPAPEPQSNP